MDIELRLLDEIKLADHLTRNFACEYSEDNRFFIITETGLYVLGLKCNLLSDLPNFFCSKFFIQLSNFLPAANVDLDLNTFHKDLDRKDLYETLMASEFSANLRNTKSLEVCPLNAAWSSAGLVGNTGCLLGVLSNTYSLEIYCKHLDENEQICYGLIMNITEEIILNQKEKWKDTTRFSIPLKIEEFKNRVNSVSVSGMLI